MVFTSCLTFEGTLEAHTADELLTRASVLWPGHMLTLLPFCLQGKANPNVVDELCADNFMIAYPMHGPRYGKEAAKQMMIDFKAVRVTFTIETKQQDLTAIQGFPDLSFGSYGDYGLIADGDFVVGRWIGGGTHTGSAFDDLAIGKLDKADTGKKMRFAGTSIFTLKEGKIVKEVGEEGAISALHQLGMLPGPNDGKKFECGEA